ncbi:MAG: isocitrate lyase/phosphoenolpyruvate mutase family protein [Trueperaceae bacterium]|jgi:2-methylisocitrate lyase-like PEP mutase family enzyme
MTTAAEAATKATELKRLHEAPEILRVVNVWDAITTKVVSSLGATKAIATAGHSIAAAHGYKDGTIPLELALAAVERIVGATDLPVTADLDAGFDNPGETIRRAIGIGVVGANVEDRLKPTAEFARDVQAIVAAGEAAGVAFQLNARTDAVLKGGDKPMDQKLADAIERGRAYLEAGASLIFVPGKLDRAATEQLVAGLGRGKLSVIGVPGALSAKEYEQLGVARISYGPWTQNYALNAYLQLAESLYADGTVPESTKALN